MDVEELQTAYKRERDPYVRERLLIVTWLKKGMTTYEAAELLGCPQSKVAYWKGRFEKEGLEGLRTRPRMGKPKKLSKDARKKIERRLEENPYGWSIREVRELIREEGNVTYSERHVIRLMHKWGFERIKPRQRHVSADEEEREAFLKTKSCWVKPG
jgi:putative transposase